VPEEFKRTRKHQPSSVECPPGVELLALDEHRGGHLVAHILVDLIERRRRDAGS
jgi:hypothetical protein